VLRTRRSAIVLGVAIVLCVALTPTPFLPAYAILVPLWSLFAFVPRICLVRGEEPHDDQPVPFLSLLAPESPLPDASQP